MSAATERRRRSNGGVRLDAERIVTAALAVADREGLAGMTMRQVGAELGADPTAVYRYFPSRDDLVAAIADRLFADIAQGPFPPHWRDRLVQLLRSARAVYRSHPTIVEVLANQAEDSASLIAINEISIGCLLAAGLEPDQVGLFHQLAVSYVIGTGMHEAAWGNPSDDARKATQRAYAALDPEEFPSCVAVADSLFPDEDAVFDFAADLIMTAIEETGRRNKRARR